MKIKSKLTKLEQTVTPEDWAKMLARGAGGKFDIISKDDEPPETNVPLESQKADYSGILKKANKAFKDKQWPAAKESFEAAKAIKETEYITGKLSEIEKILTADKEES